MSRLTQRGRADDAACLCPSGRERWVGRPPRWGRCARLTDCHSLSLFDPLSVTRYVLHICDFVLPKHDALSAMRFFVGRLCMILAVPGGLGAPPSLFRRPAANTSEH